MRQINRVAVLGAGVMGATIAAHLANAGLEVLLLDIVPKELDKKEEAKGLTLESPVVRNRIAANGLQGMLKMRPAPFYLKDYASLIEVGNFEDDLEKLNKCDWIVEVVIEYMPIKLDLLKKIVPHLAPDAILATNTSGLSVNEMAEVLPPEVQKNFLVTHFFNPPRYMRLMELVPCKYTAPEVMKDMAIFMSKRLGKGIVYAKDTTNFIANRIGVYGIYKTIEHMMALDMTVEEVDAVAGTATARSKGAAFRTSDLVGIDVMAHVGTNNYELVPDDEERDVFQLPDFVKKMIENGQLGNKTRQGFYKKDKVDGKRVIFYYDYKTGEYKPIEKPKFASLKAIKGLDDAGQKLKMVIAGNDKAANFAWLSTRDSLIYTVNRIPEIADDVVNIDNALRWGFNWELGPFEMLDAIGVDAFVKRAEADGVAVPDALKGVESFYRHNDKGQKEYWDILKKEYALVPVKDGQIQLDILKKSGNNVVEKNAGSSVVDLGDGVFCLEFHSKMNSIGGDILAMTHKAIKRAEEEGVGLVLGNQGPNFSVGANLMLVAMALAEGAFDEINMTIKAFQNATMALKYSKIPVVAAPFGMTLGGGAEFCLHSDSINAHAETYMGLVEVGVGLLPGGGGTKEMALRAIELAAKNKADVQPFIAKNFQQIAMANVSMGASELFGLDYMRNSDSISMDIDTLIGDAKKKVLALAVNYRPKSKVINLPAPGRGVAAAIKSMLWNMQAGNFISEYDYELSSVIAEVMCGGDVARNTMLTEEYLLEIEREGFMKLCTKKKTGERIQHMLKTGKPLRN